jgi:beta-glucosidase
MSTATVAWLSTTSGPVRHGPGLEARRRFDDTVAKTGARDGTTVVPVYVRQPVSDVIAPPRRLVGFARVDVAAGASQPVHVSFPVSELAATPDDIDSSERPRVELGSYQVEVGSQTVNLSFTG